MTHDARPTADRKACPPHHGLHVVMSPTAAARATCPCGWWRAGMGRRGAVEVIQDYEAHRDACGRQTGAQRLQGAA